MADSKDNNKDHSSEKKIDDLDEMLNQAENEIEEIDEFGDDTVEQLLVEDNFDEKGLVDSINTSSIIEEDEFADDFVEKKPETDSNDLIIDDFDISSSENGSSELESEFEEKKDDEVSSAMEDLGGQITQADELLEKVVSDVGQEADKDENSSADTTGINTQLNQIWAENEELKEQLAILTTKSSDISIQNLSTVEQLEDLQKKQRKIVRTIEDKNSKLPVLTYVALGIAILALLIAGLFAAMGSGDRTQISELTELVATLEEEIVILIANNSKEGIQQIDEKIKLLVANDEFINKKLNESSSEPESIFLKPVVDGLVKQSDDSKQAIEELVAKVNKLEQRKPIQVKQRKTKKATVNKGWVVNLVAFRQKWYAQNKLEEFKKKGISAELIEVKVKGETWFRLRVKGFKNKSEANAFSTNVKKTLNLGSVWVTKG